MIISVTRLMNHGLVLLSPIILVRLLTVEQFGNYREFLVYVGILTAICGFSINQSLLYFIPSRPNAAGRVLRQTVVLAAVCSSAVIAATLLLNELLRGELLGWFAWPIAIYVLFFVNLDFWEYYWLAGRRPLPVLAYTSGRLVARLTVVITAAAVARDVQVIVWSLVALEAVRLTGSFLGWRSVDATADRDADSCWRDQIRYCLPIGTALVLVVLNRQLGNLFVAKVLGVVALAHYAIGTHIQPVIAVLRNSISDALLPELASLRQSGRQLELWQRATVMSMMLLGAAAVVLVEFAHPLVVTLFSAKYEPAVPVLQLFSLVLLRETFDFGVALRALNRTAPVVHSNLLALGLNALLLTTLLPIYGLAGAVVAFVVSRYADAIYLGRCTARAYGVSIGALARWRDLAKVAVALAAASVVFYGSLWTDVFGFAGVFLGSAAYVTIAAALLAALRVPEIMLLLRRLKNSGWRIADSG